MPVVNDSLHRDKEKDFPYFRPLWRRVVVALLIAIFLPMILLAGGIYYYSALYGTDFLRAPQQVLTFGVFVFIIGTILIMTTVFLTTNHLVRHLEKGRRDIYFLDHQIRRTSMMASSMRLSSEFFLEIKDVMGNIDMAAQWCRELTERGLLCPEDLNELMGSLRQIMSETSHIRKSVERILNFTQPTTPMISDIDIKSMLEELLVLFERKLKLRRIEMIREYDHELPPVRSDPSLIRQVFLNLIFNAITAVKSDGRITLRTLACENQLKVAVSDNGPGIPEKNMEKIFEPFFTTRRGDIGLGLSVCRNNLERVGGAITVDSAPGEGASFTVEIPYKFNSSVSK
jgi:signal transduction histidine kinase